MMGATVAALGPAVAEAAPMPRRPSSFEQASMTERVLSTMIQHREQVVHLLQ